MDGGEAGWVEEPSRNAVAVEKPLEARLEKGMGRWMGGGSDKGRSIGKKYKKAGWRGGQTILLSLSEPAADLSLTVLMDRRLWFSAIRVCLH